MSATYCLHPGKDPSSSTHQPLQTPAQPLQQGWKPPHGGGGKPWCSGSLEHLLAENFHQQKWNQRVCCGKVETKMQLMSRSFSPIPWAIGVTPPKHYFVSPFCKELVSSLSSCAERKQSKRWAGLFEQGSVGCIPGSEIAGSISCGPGRNERNIKLHFHYQWGLSGLRIRTRAF